MLLVGKDVKYASSGNVLNGALTPDLLDAGSIGIYLVGSDGRLKLVVPSTTTPAAGLVLASAVLPTDKITMYQGLGGGSQLTSETHQVKGIFAVLGSIYRVGTAQTVYIGYNPITGLGDLNAVFLPTVGTGGNGLTYTDPDLLYRQEAQINYRQRMLGNNEFGNFHNIAVPVIPTDTALTVAQKLVAQTNQIQPFDTRQDFTAVLTGNVFAAPPVATTSSTATTGGTLVPVTYYYKIIAFNTLGQSLGSNEISQVVPAGTNTNTVTVNWAAVTGATGYRVYRGVAAGAESVFYTVGNVTTFVDTNAASTVGVVPTTVPVGIALTAISYNAAALGNTLYNDESVFPLWAVSVFGVIQNATVTEGGVIDPSGYPYQIRKIEKTSMAYRGDLYTLSVLDRHLPSQVDFSATYDLYQVKTINTTDDKTGAKALTDQQILTHVAFVVQANVPGTNQQADWEDIMVAIFPATQQIS